MILSSSFLIIFYSSLYFFFLQGLDQTLLFAHHNKSLKNNLISWYDEQFNKRERSGGDQLPELRHWDGQKLAWEPEKTDHPVKGKIPSVW